jgi:hypothetical protein
MIELALHGAQAGFDVAKAFPIRELSKRHTKELIPTGKAPDFVIATIAMDATTELIHRQVGHQLSKNTLSRIHGPLLSAGWQWNGEGELLVSNR